VIKKESAVCSTTLERRSLSSCDFFPSLMSRKMTRPTYEDAPGRSGVIRLRVADLEGRIAGVEISGEGRLGTSAHRRSGLCPAGGRQTGISEDFGYQLTIDLIAVTLLLDRWWSPCRGLLLWWRRCPVQAHGRDGTWAYLFLRKNYE
jgi:hypothetical protein